LDGKQIVAEKGRAQKSRWARSESPFSAILESFAKRHANKRGSSGIEGERKRKPRGRTMKKN